MPVLFGLVGATVNFAVLDRGIIARACIIVIAGARRPPAQPCTALLSTCRHASGHACRVALLLMSSMCAWSCVSPRLRAVAPGCTSAAGAMRV